MKKSIVRTIERVTLDKYLRKRIEAYIRSQPLLSKSSFIRTAIQEYLTKVS